MSEFELRFSERISKTQARHKLVAFGVWGEHSVEPRPRSGPEVAWFLAEQGHNPDAIVDRLRDPRSPVPYFQKLLREGRTYVGTGKTGVVDLQTGEWIQEFTGPGVLYLRAYAGQFQAAEDARRKAVEESSFDFWHSALVKGFASLEGYLRAEAFEWNKTSSDQIDLSPGTKISFDDMLGWVPRITGGNRVDKGGAGWQTNRRLKKIRDDLEVHPKATSFASSLESLARQINDFRSGVADFHFHLHQSFGRPVPATILLSAFSPDVEVRKVDATG